MKLGKVASAVWAICLTSFAAATCFAAETLTGPAIKVEVSAGRDHPLETVLIRQDDTWVAVLAASPSVFVHADQGLRPCSLDSAGAIAGGLLLSGECGVGKFEQRILLTADSDVLRVSTRLHLRDNVTLHSVEDRYDFLPPRHAHEDEHTGPLDFVWSQNIKSEADDLIPTNGFKSPAVMMQQGSVFVALLPQLNERHPEVRALDLDVTSGLRPWLSYGAIASEPHDHSYFRRDIHAKLAPIANTVEYQYSIVVLSQPARLGYRRVVRLLWKQSGHPALLASGDEQKNILRPELNSFESWQEEAWHTYADSIYRSFRCGERTCGTLASNRNFQGDWQHPAPDAWFNAWFQTVRTAYGWYLHGRATGDTAMMAKAESVLNLALSSPRKDGAFATIYLLDTKKWLPGDGWASYADSYHSFSMSWTAYWMLRWAEDLTPDRKPEILNFVRSYGDFLVAHQQPNGVIPSWYEAGTLQPRSEFKEFNAETAPSALLLAELGKVSGDQRYIAAAERGMDFIAREVIPRQRWFDFETFLSCARKDYSFYDHWTAQFPQNNLAEIQAPQAMLLLFQITGKREYLERGTEMLDYLLMTQQVWNNPQFSPYLLGGFTTQNTDAEWSDARQGYAATVLADYYQATGNVEYLERSVAAARSTFSVAPWENWAHTGYIDQPGALTGFHWGTGSAMTTVEILKPKLGDALIDVAATQGVGFDQCTLTVVQVRSGLIAFNISSSNQKRDFLVRFRGLDATQQYRVSWNGGDAQLMDGAKLSLDGLLVSIQQEKVP
jgi:hypothetical protein